MKPEESSYPGDWLRLAQKDWERVERMLNEADCEMAGWCLQQALEKFLKAFLLAQGWKLRRVHDLAALLDDAVRYESSLEQYRAACEKVTAFYFINRYPSILPEDISEGDVREPWKQVKPLVALLTRKTLSPSNE